MSKSFRSIAIGKTTFTIKQESHSNCVTTFIEVAGNKGIIEDSTGTSDCWMDIENMSDIDLQEYIINSLLGSINSLEEQIYYLQD